MKRAGIAREFGISSIHFVPVMDADGRKRGVLEYGVASAYAANYFTLTLDRDDPLFVDGDPLPPAWHYFYFHELVALAATGEDGHRAKGDFMPPLPFPR